MPLFPVVLAGPSGSGKTTVARRLMKRRDDLLFSVSATTRPRRPGEREGEDYRFVDREAFRRLREEGELLEWAEVHGELYGTPRDNLREARRAKAHLVLDIDVQGARAVTRSAPETVTIFLLPPSGPEILRRLRDRGTEDPERLRRRLLTAGSELEAVAEFDYAVVNDDLETTVSTVEAVIRAERHRIERTASSVVHLAKRTIGEIRRAAESVSSPPRTPERTDPR